MTLFSDLISPLSILPGEVLMVLEFIFCGSMILGAHRLFGLSGLYLYTGVGVIAANIAVLKVVPFSFYPHPMALGTIVFGSLFLCNDVINEHYGKEAALKSIWLGFFAYLLMMGFMVLSLGYDGRLSASFQSSIAFLFLPAPALFVSSLIAYFASQYVDVILYHFIHTKTGKNYLWARSFVSMGLAMLIDNTIFSFLAWYVFALQPLSLYEIFWTYILGATVIRAVASFGNVGFMYLSSFLNRNRKSNVVALS